MPSTDSLWIVFTIIAAGAQSLRNAAQSSLTARIGTLGATYVRFLFGLPFAILALTASGIFRSVPDPNWTWLLYITCGSLTQIGATVLMLAAMRSRSFVVTTTYTKTEPMQVALFALIFLGEHISLGLGLAIVISTFGVVILSIPARAAAEAFSLKPALLGLGSGALFALSAIGFRGGILELGDADYIGAGTLTLVYAQALQTLLLSAWLRLRTPGAVGTILRMWRQSLTAGFLGFLGSQMWLFAFALETAARVRTLGLVEIVIAAFISRRVFAQRTSLRDAAGMALIIAGVAILLNSS